METLDVGALVEVGGNALPVLGAVFADQLCELLVLLLVPVPLVLIQALSFVLGDTLN